MIGGRHHSTELGWRLYVLSDAYRLNIVRLLAQHGEQTVSELVARLGKSQPLVSFHLRLLRMARLVTKHRRGRQALYALDYEQFARCQRMLAEVITIPAADEPARDGMATAWDEARGTATGGDRTPHGSTTTPAPL